MVIYGFWFLGEVWVDFLSFLKVTGGNFRDGGM